MSACKKEPCKLIYLRALKNAASGPATLPILLNILRAEGGGGQKKKRSNSKVALVAVKAVQSLLPIEEGATTEVVSTLMSVFRSVSIMHRVRVKVCFLGCLIRVARRDRSGRGEGNRATFELIFFETLYSIIGATVLIFEQSLTR